MKVNKSNVILIMSFPCLICQYIFEGKYLWNIHGSSLDEDRHLLCSTCLIKYSEKNVKCPLRCNNTFNPIKLNSGYEQLITGLHETFVKENIKHQSIPDEDIIKNRKLWNKLIHNVEDYINLDFYPIVYGIGVFRNLTYFMRTLKSTDFENNIEEIFKINKQIKLTDIFNIKIGVKRKYIEQQIVDEIIEQTPIIELELTQLLNTYNNN